MLGRRVLAVGEDDSGGYVAGATVLVTGAAGSVGAELCARLIRLGAGALVLVDQAEAPLTELAATLREEHEFAAVPVLADVRSAARVAEVFERFRPQVVFHAAAYKQVPLVEAHPVEGAAVNVLGTQRLVDAAERAGVARFVLFSTDKAVEPASVLGRTKAVAEWAVAAAGDDVRTAAVRLGNVVDSAGSILPLFRRQLARGGPVTVTHPEMTRYLMTAGEAAGLAIVAGALADTTVSWLDVGPPVRVVDLVRRLAPDVEIELVGLRPGERLHERPFWSGDEVVATPFAHVVAAPLHRVDRRWLDGRLAVLAHHVERASAAGVRAVLTELEGAPAREAELAEAGVAR